MAITINGSTGVQLDDNDKQKFGTGNDLEIYHDGTHNYIKNTHATGYTLIDATSNIKLRTNDTETGLEVVKDGGVELYYNNAKVFETLEYGAKIKRPSGGSTDLEVIGCEGQDAYIHVWADEGDDNADKWKMGALTDGSFRIQNYADGAWENSIIANGGGNTKLFHNNTEVLETTSGGVQVNGTTNALKVTHTGGSCVVLERNSKQLTFNANYGAQDTYSTFNVGSGMGYKFYLNGSPYITINSSGVLSGDLNDTSDEKKKKNITSIPDGAIAKIKQLRPVNFNWKNPLNTADQSGFIAQEVKTVIPDLVSGEEYDEAKGDIGYAINTTGVVAHLTKALQEAITKIETLETKVAALEAA